MKAGNLGRAVQIYSEIKECEALLEQLEHTHSSHVIRAHECVDVPTFDAFRRATKTNLEKKIDELRAEALTL